MQTNSVLLRLSLHALLSFPLDSGWVRALVLIMFSVRGREEWEEVSRNTKNENENQSVKCDVYFWCALASAGYFSTVSQLIMLKYRRELLGMFGIKWSQVG